MSNFFFNYVPIVLTWYLEEGRQHVIRIKLNCSFWSQLEVQSSWSAEIIGNLKWGFQTKSGKHIISNQWMHIVVAEPFQFRKTGDVLVLDVRTKGRPDFIWLVHFRKQKFYRMRNPVNIIYSTFLKIKTLQEILQKEQGITQLNLQKHHTPCWYFFIASCSFNTALNWVNINKK